MVEDRGRVIWRRMAPRYDNDMRFADRWWFPGGREWVCSQAAGDVLEVAVGTGRNLPYYPTGTRLTGADFSPEMLAHAGQRAWALGRAVALVVADAQALPFGDRCFDTVVCTLGLCCIPDQRAAIGEMTRVLRPGGQLLLLDHIVSSNPLLRLAQRGVEQITRRVCGDFMTRRPALQLPAAGLLIDHSERAKAGTVERVRARKPAS